MQADLEKAVEAGKLSPKNAEALKDLPPGAYCMHKSWGFGQVESINFLVNQMTIHFASKRDHSMQLEYAAESLSPVPADHILARKATDLPGVKEQVAKDPVGLVRSILQHSGNKASAEQIEQLLSPEVFSAAEFKKWWDSAKKQLKKDGHFSVPSRRADAVELRDAPVSRADEMIAAFDQARQLKQLVAALDQIAKSPDAFEGNTAPLTQVVERASREARKNQRLKPAEAFELIVSRDEICRGAGVELPGDAIILPQILHEEERKLRDILATLAVSKQKRVFSAFPQAFGEDWVAKALTQLQHSGSVRVVAEIARLLQDQGKHEELRSTLNRWIREHSITSEILYWLCKERTGEFSDLVVPQVFPAILAALERDQVSETKRSGKLHDLLMSDRELIPDLLRDADKSVARDSMRRFMMSPVFEELNKRSLLARIVKTHPELQSMIAGGEVEQQEALVVSWASLEKKKAQYEELVNKKIPENIKEISIAREYGDLRENFEFKAAKEMQRVLARQRAEMERDLANSRGTNFENPDTSVVSIGTNVTVRESDGSSTTYSILGAWDSDPESNIISYKAQIGQALLGHPVGDKVTLPSDTGERSVEIVNIEVCATAPVSA